MSALGKNSKVDALCTQLDDAMVANTRVALTTALAAFEALPMAELRGDRSISLLTLADDARATLAELEKAVRDACAPLQGVNDADRLRAALAEAANALPPVAGDDEFLAAVAQAQVTLAGLESSASLVVASTRMLVDIADLAKTVTNPIIGIANAPLLSLSDAIKASGLALSKQCIKMAEAHFKDMSPPCQHGLTSHEVAAIHLYTQESPLYHTLNELLRDEARGRLRPFFSYLRLLLQGLAKLPRCRGHVYRGMKRHLLDTLSAAQKAMPLHQAMEVGKRKLVRLGVQLCRGGDALPDHSAEAHISHFYYPPCADLVGAE